MRDQMNSNPGRNPWPLGRATGQACVKRKAHSIHPNGSFRNKTRKQNPRNLNLQGEGVSSLDPGHHRSLPVHMAQKKMPPETVSNLEGPLQINDISGSKNSQVRDSKRFW